MNPTIAVLHLLADALAEFRHEMNLVGMTSTIDVSTDPKGDVQASVVFHVPRALAERLAAKPV